MPGPLLEKTSLFKLAISSRLFEPQGRKSIEPMLQAQVTWQRPGLHPWHSSCPSDAPC
jgi:hypothetical protein